MTDRELLGQIYGFMNMPIEQYVKQLAVRELSVKFDLLERIEPYRLPEIVKLISSHDNLIDRFGSNYCDVKSFYANYDCSGNKDINPSCINYIEKVMYEASVSASFFIDKIFPYADESILRSFSQAYNRLTIKLNELSNQKKAVESTRHQIESLEEEISDAKAELEIIKTEDGKEKAAELKKSIGQKKKKLSNIKSKSEEPLRSYSDLLSQIESVNRPYEMFSDAYSEVQRLLDSIDDRISKARNDVYQILKTPLGASDFIKQYRQSRQIPEQLISILKKPETAVDFYRDISCFNDSVEIIASLYDAGALDIWDETCCAFLKRNHSKVCSFFVENRFLDSEKTCDSDEFRSWLNWIVENALYTNDAAILEYDAVWEQITTTEQWEKILLVIREMDEERFCDCLAKIILHTSGISRKKLLTKTQQLIEERVIESVSNLASALVENHTSGDDCAEMIARFIQKIENSQYQLTNENKRLKRKNERVASEIYGAVSKQIESLELLASNFDCGGDPIAPKLVASNLKKRLAELRSGLEELGVYPLEDVDAWITQKKIKFDPVRHTINVTNPPQTVYLRTLGFTYKNSDGETENSLAVAGRLNNILPETRTSSLKTKKTPSSKKMESSDAKPKGGKS